MNPIQPMFFIFQVHLSFIFRNEQEYPKISYDAWTYDINANMI